MPMDSSYPIIFDRNVYKLHLARACANAQNNILLATLEESLTERAKIFKDSYENALFYNAPNFNYKPMGIKRSTFANLNNSAITFDEEEVREPEEYYDLIVSISSLHMVNDLPGALKQYRRLTNSGGVFFATFYGGQTLMELRKVLALVDNRCFSGIAPRVFPMIDIKDAAALLQRAGFINPVADTESIALKFKDVFELMYFIKDMGQSNCLYLREKKCLPKNYFKMVAEEYIKQFAENGSIIATFEIITLTGRG